MKRLFLLLSCLLCLGGCSNKIEISALGLSADSESIKRKQVIV